MHFSILRSCGTIQPSEDLWCLQHNQFYQQCSLETKKILMKKYENLKSELCLCVFTCSVRLVEAPTKKNKKRVVLTNSWSNIPSVTSNCCSTCLCCSVSRLQWRYSSVYIAHPNFLSAIDLSRLQHRWV